MREEVSRGLFISEVSTCGSRTASVSRVLEYTRKHRQWMVSALSRIHRIEHKLKAHLKSLSPSFLVKSLRERPMEASNRSRSTRTFSARSLTARSFRSLGSIMSVDSSFVVLAAESRALNPVSVVAFKKVLKSSSRSEEDPTAS